MNVKHKAVSSGSGWSRASNLVSVDHKTFLSSYSVRVPTGQVAMHAFHGQIQFSCEFSMRKKIGTFTINNNNDDDYCGRRVTWGKCLSTRSSAAPCSRYLGQWLRRLLQRRVATLPRVPASFHSVWCSCCRLFRGKEKKQNKISKKMI